MPGEAIRQGFLRTDTGSSQSDETDHGQCRKIDQVHRHGSNGQEAGLQQCLSDQ